MSGWAGGWASRQAGGGRAGDKLHTDIWCRHRYRIYSWMSPRNFEMMFARQKSVNDIEMRRLMQKLSKAAQKLEKK